MVSLAFVISFVVSAVAMLIGIVIFTEVEDGMIGTFGAPVLVQNGTSGIITDSPLYGCEAVSSSLNPVSSNINEINTNDGSVISSVNNGFTWCYGMSVDPTTGIYYSVPASGSIGLHILDPVLGNSTYLGTSFSTSCNGSGCFSMAFDGLGDLFFTSDEFTPINNIHKIDKSDGSEISDCTPTNNIRSSLGFNYDNDKMYRITESPLILEVIDPNTCATSETVAITGMGGSPTSFAYHTGDELFYVMVNDGGGSSPDGDGTLDYYSLQTDGTATLITDDVTNLHIGIQTVYQSIVFAPTTGVATPPIYEDQVPESFASASSIGLTVLGVLPIALFFALFTILSGRVDGGE